MEVKERWWHRLIKVVLVMQFFAVMIVGAFFAYHMSSEWRQSYSWQANWQERPGAVPCEVLIFENLRSSSVSCKGIYSARELADQMAADGFISSTNQLGRLDDYALAVSLEKLLRDHPSRSWGGSEFSAKGAVVGVGVLLLMLVLDVILAVATWRLLIYVFHGRGAKLT